MCVPVYVSLSLYMSPYVRVYVCCFAVRCCCRSTHIYLSSSSVLFYNNVENFSCCCCCYSVNKYHIYTLRTDLPINEPRDPMQHSTNNRRKISFMQNTNTHLNPMRNGKLHFDQKRVEKQQRFLIDTTICRLAWLTYNSYASNAFLIQKNALHWQTKKAQWLMWKLLFDVIVVVEKFFTTLQCEGGKTSEKENEKQDG